MNKSSLKVLQIMNILAFVAVVVVNALSNYLPINNVTMSDVTYTYPHAFIPASFAFGIWSIIYFLLLMFCIYQSIDVNKVPESSIGTESYKTVPQSHPYTWVQVIGPWFIVACIMNIMWVFLWQHFMITASLVAMIGYFISLAVIYRRIHSVNRTIQQKDKWFVLIPFSINLAWVAVAMLANLSTWLVFAGVPGLGLSAELWACILIGTAAVVAFRFKYSFNDVAYVLVTIWALAAIAYRQYHDEPGMNAVAVAALIGIAVLAISLFIKPAHGYTYQLKRKTDVAH